MFYISSIYEFSYIFVLLNKYEFIILCMLNRYLRELDDSFLKNQWQNCKDTIQDELEILKDIDNEMKLIKEHNHDFKKKSTKVIFF